MSRSHACRFIVAALLAFAAISVATDFAYAQDSNANNAVGPEGFRASKGPSTENVPGVPLLAIGYGGLWLLVFAFVYRIIRGQIAMRRKMERLETLLTEAGSGAKQ